MEFYDLTLKKEALREGTWEVLAKISKIENKIGENPFLTVISKSLVKKITNLSNMSEEEVKDLIVIKNFLNDNLKEIQGE